MDTDADSEHDTDSASLCLCVSVSQDCSLLIAKKSPDVSRMFFLYNNLHP